MMRGASLFAVLLVTFQLVGASVIKPESHESECSTDELEATTEVVVDSLASVYCNSGYLERGLKTVTFLEKFFDEKANDEKVLPKDELKKVIEEALYCEAKELRDALKNIKQECLEDFGDVIAGGEDKEITKEKFVDAFNPVLHKEEPCKGVTIYDKTNMTLHQSSTDTCSGFKLEATEESIAKAMAVVYCNEKEKKKDHQLEPETFLKEYFAKFAEEDKTLAKGVLVKSLSVSLPLKATDIKEELAIIKPACVEAFEKEVTDSTEHGRITEEKFLEYFKELLEKENVCNDVKIYKEAKKHSGYSFELLRRPFYFLSYMFGRGFIYFIRMSPPCKPKDLKEAEEDITEAFQVLYCAEKLCTPGIKPTPFLSDYFNKTTDKVDYLQKEAFQQNLIKALPEEAKKLKERLSDIKSTCISSFKDKIAGKLHGKVDKTKFMKYFTPRISDSKFCDNIQSYYENQQNTTNTVQDLMEAEERKKPHVIEIPLFIQRDKHVVKTYLSGKPFKPSNTSKPVKYGDDSPKAENSTLKHEKSIECSERELISTGETIKHGFAVLYCNIQYLEKELQPKQFLQDYFQKFAEKGVLASEALREKLSKTLPGEAEKLKGSISNLRTCCVESLRREIAKEEEGDISQDEFVDYFLPAVSSDDLCNSVKIYW